MKFAKRLADKGRMFESLAAYANLGDQPEDWHRFHLMYPEFFPDAPSAFKQAGFQNIREWMYGFAEVWAKEFADLPPDRRPIPPLLWYRNRLRAVWTMNDKHGYSLAILLGFEKEARNIGSRHPGEIDVEMLARPLLIPGQPTNPSRQESEGLPQGRPVIDGLKGEILWDFGCALQQGVYDLMRNRWRAKVCPKCGKFFIAGKNAQTFCSDHCSNDAKRERSLTWWNEKGKRSRAKSKARGK